ncbi:UNVERIFIED_CONTAM: hypothetical protein FKN15_012536 [Acipenser sinensis]
MAASSVFHRLRTGSKLGAQYDQEGNLIQVETREDEEQNVKLAEILELLVAAGYFRARIKGLSPFDKVVGGMTWCITTCNFDIDVDLLFQENSTIGQKIALTEKIVSVLPKMKCPHRLEPHQIQGLDFIHIFPVVQWLVKRAIETREEMGDYIRAYSVSQFQKTHSIPEDNDFMQRKEKAIKTVMDVSEVYKPLRKYKRQVDAEELVDEESRVHSTLLEYGRRYGFSRQAKQDKAEDKKAFVTPGLPHGMSEVSEEEDLQAAEELRIKTLMTGMAVMATEEQSECSAEDRPERFGAAQQHRRLVASLNKQIAQKSKQVEELQAKHLEVQSGYEEAKSKLMEAVNFTEKLHKELAALEELECHADSSVLQKLRALVAMNENLKNQEQEFRTHCREEMTRLQQSIENLKIESGDDDGEQKARRNREIAILQRKIDEVPSRAELTQYQKRFIELYGQGLLEVFIRYVMEEMTRLQQSIENLKIESGDDDGEQKERNQLIDKQYNTDREKLQKIRLLLARRNREIAILQRKIDEVPSRAELTQYQKRFIELYGQVAATHKETKQFFTLYNTLDDKKVFLEKEMEKKKQENKMRRDQLNDEYLELLEKQRLYFKTVKDFKEECRKNEMLLSKLRAKGAS